MSIQSALKSQYHASLKMLGESIKECPPELWLTGPNPVPFWRVAYHTLFFTHLYLQPDLKSFKPWKHHRNGCQSLAKRPAPKRRPTKPEEPYKKKQILEYWKFCDTLVDTAVDRLDLDARTCGFWWYRLPKLDHQINNIRHIQHHAALLAGRLRQSAGINITWVGRP